MSKPTVLVPESEMPAIDGLSFRTIRGERDAEFVYGVRPAWRRQGLAGALLTRALWDLRQQGVEIIRLSTIAEFRTRARDLYYSVGFRVLKEFHRYRKNPAH